MAWRESGRIRRPWAWASTGVHRELTRRLPRCGGSRRRLLALVERRGRALEVTVYGGSKQADATVSGVSEPGGPHTRTGRNGGSA